MTNIKLIKYLYEINFEKNLQKLIKDLKKKKVIIYGTGLLFDTIINNFSLSDLNIIGISDLKYSSTGIDTDKGYKIIPLESIKKAAPDYILVATEYYDSIINNFKNNLFKDAGIKILPLAKKNINIKISEFFSSLKGKKPDKYDVLKEQIDNLYYLFSCYNDIKSFPAAKGNLRNIQLGCVTILNSIVDLCKENNLNYWLDSGTLLGAYRHKGYIPWDNDIDICMCKSDMLKMLPILKKYFSGTQYYVRERAEKSNNYQFRIINKFNPKIAVDIFPLDFYIKKNLTDYEKLLVTKKIKKARKVLEQKYNKKTLSIDKIPRARKDINQIQNDIIFNNQVVQTSNPALFYSIDFPYNPKHFLIMNYDMIFPLKEIEFEGRLYSCPNDVQGYLENLYDNYMSYPKSIVNWWY